jgi:hypothetical protein
MRTLGRQALAACHTHIIVELDCECPMNFFIIIYNINIYKTKKQPTTPLKTVMDLYPKDLPGPLMRLFLFFSSAPLRPFSYMHQPTPG